MKFKSTMAAAWIAAACISAAHADTRNIGVLGSVEAVETFAPVKGSFFDTINFDVTAQSVLSGSGVSTFLKLGGKTVKDISGLNLTFWDNYHPDGYNLLGVFSGDGNTFSFALPSAGRYHVDITGDAIGTKGGVYTVAFSTVTAVPEPESYALFLAGLRLMGTIVRRRTQKTAV